MPTSKEHSEPLVNAPFKNPSADDLTEIEVTDRMHPLFGRRFAVISLSTSPRGAGHAIVVYQGHMRIQQDVMRTSASSMRIRQDVMRTSASSMRIRIPLSATQLALPRQNLGTKLTLESVTELVTLVQQSEILCPSHRMPSGAALPPRSKRKSSANSKPSSRK